MEEMKKCVRGLTRGGIRVILTLVSLTQKCATKSVEVNSMGLKEHVDVFFLRIGRVGAYRHVKYCRGVTLRVIIRWQ